MKYKISKYAKIHGVLYRTVWNWVKAGKVKYETDATGHIWITEGVKEREKTYAIYARVSSSENKANLDSQVDRLISYCNARGYKVSKVVKEIGSGLNDERKSRFVPRCPSRNSGGNRPPAVSGYSPNCL